VARALYRTGPRRQQAFVVVNCSAVVEALFESELFGHVKGSYTGATETTPGLFELADGGTIFLDEVGELPLTVQAKLLRVLETGDVQRVGATAPRRVDVHVLAATNRDLLAEVAAKRFRSDLYYRINVVELTVPPLRDRREDIPYLVAAFRP
jgi:two-component system response regulator HydG